MSKLSFKEKLLVVVMLCAVIVFCSYSVVGKKLKKQVETATSQLTALQNEKQQKDEVINGKTMREQGIGQLFFDIGEIEKTYAVGTTHENMDKIFTTLASAHDLVTSNFSVTRITENTDEHNKRLANKEDTKSEKVASVIDTSKTVKSPVDNETDILVTAESGLIVECYSYTLQGSYKAMLDFLEDLNKDEKLQVRSFNMAYNTEDELAATLNINIYLKELGADYQYAKDIIMQKYGYLSDRLEKINAEAEAKIAEESAKK
jgi:hypothetical protein